MIRNLCLILLILLTGSFASGQSFEVSGVPETVNGHISQTLRIPIKIRNTTDKPQIFIIRLAESDFRATQKGYFCLDGDCSDSQSLEISRKIEGNSSLSGLSFVVESGLVGGLNNLSFEVLVKGNGAVRQEFPVQLLIDEKGLKNIVYKSPQLTLHDLYPNPVATMGFMDYELHQENIKAKIVVHNILGSPVGEQELPFFETRAKISVEDLAPGVYFYTVYLDNDGIVTKKLIVRR